MSAKRRPPAKRREPGEFVPRVSGQSEPRPAIPHASLKQRARELMKQPPRTDVFRAAYQPHDVEEVFIPRRFNFVEQAAPPGEPSAPAAERPAGDVKRRPAAPAAEERVEPQVSLPAEEDPDPLPEDDDLELPPPSAQPLQAGERLDLSGLDEYDGSELFDEADPDQTAEPTIPQEERTELPAALRNRRNYFENSDQNRKGGLLGGIIPGGSRPAAKSSGKRR